MKLVKFSLIAILSTGSWLSANDTLSDAFKNGKINGEIRTYYFERDIDKNAADKDGNEILDFALKLKYETSSFYGFKMGTTLQGVSSPFADEEVKVSDLKKDMYGPGSVLSEAYIAYNFGKTDIKFGRQFSDVLLAKSTASRAIIEAYEGLSVVNKDIPDTKLAFMYFTKYQGHTDLNGNIGEFDKLSDTKLSNKTLYADYAYTLAAENKSISGLTLSAAYGEMQSIFSLIYIEAIYTNQFSSIDYNLGLQYGQTNYNDTVTKAHDAFFYGAKFGLGYDGLKAYVAYSDIQDGTAKWQLIGTGNKPLLFTTTITASGQYEASEQYAVDVNYFIKPLALTIGARNVHVNYSSTSFVTTLEEANYPSFYASCEFSGALKGLFLSAQFEKKDSNLPNQDWKELRLRANYKF